jgi:HlyD family secretion protein
MKWLKKEQTTSAKQVSAPPKRKIKKKWIILPVIAVAVVIGVVLFTRFHSGQAQAKEVEYTTVAVQRQDITSSLSGSGTLEPADSYTVTSLVTGEVTADYFEDGDTVSEGDVLYKIDASSASTNVTQSQMNYQQAVKAKYPKATISGEVSAIDVSEGDEVKSGDALCTIVGDNSLNMTFYFADVSTSAFYVGQSATVYIDLYEGGISGTVTAVSASEHMANNDTTLTAVKVKADNPGSVTTANTATASIGGYTSYGSADVTYAGVSTVYASGSGTVTGFSLLLGDRVTEGQTICTLASDSLDNSITNAKISLSNAGDTLDKYSVTAPISGTVVEKNVKAGDNLASSNSGATSMAVIYDLTYLKMELAVDELDISQISEGQSVAITADAVDGTFTGTVSKVSITGTTTNGVTTYPVTVVVEDYGDLLPGMNVTAEIVTASASNALSIPSAAVQRGNLVMITADSPSASSAAEQTAPDGYVYVQVETGVSSDSSIEIVSGLQEGDTVAYQTASSDSEETEEQAMMGMPGGGMPSGGGGMPSGAPSGGGMPSGGGFGG